MSRKRREGSIAEMACTSIVAHPSNPSASIDGIILETVNYEHRTQSTAANVKINFAISDHTYHKNMFYSYTTKLKLCSQGKFMYSHL